MAVPTGFGPMVAEALTRLPACRAHDTTSAIFARGRLLLFGLEVAHYHITYTYAPSLEPVLARTEEVDDDAADEDNPEYLDYLLFRYGSNVEGAIAAYNAGRSSPDYTAYRARQNGAQPAPAAQRVASAVSLSFTSGLLSLNASRNRLSGWALDLYGRDRFAESASTRRRFPYAEGNTLYIAPFVSRDRTLRNYAETSVFLTLRPETKFTTIAFRDI